MVQYSKVKEGGKVPNYISTSSQAERWFLLYNFFISNSGKKEGISYAEIRNFYREHGIELNPKTIRADIAAISGDLFGLSIEYNRKLNKGAGAYVLKNPPLTPNELRLIVDSIQASKFITQNEARNLTSKIKRLAGVNTSKNTNNSVIVVDRIRSMNDSVIKDAGKIYQAMATDKKLVFKMFHYARDGSKVYSRNGKVYAASPFATLWLNGYYYLYAYVDGENKFRYFRLDRIENIIITHEKREGKEKYDAKGLIKRDTKLFAIKEAKEYNVNISFNNGLVDAVRDQFGKDIIMTPQDENHFTITAKIQTSTEFYAWLFTFGRGAKIISPKEVADKMREYALNVAEMYHEEEKM